MDYLDGTEVDATFIDARPRTTQISLRLDRETISRLKTLARKRGIGYQTMIRMWVVERLAQEG
jgi:predicted DNA binding CopG/RHH family protein